MQRGGGDGIQPERLNAEGDSPSALSRGLSVSATPGAVSPLEKRLKDANVAAKEADFRVFQTHHGRCYDTEVSIRNKPTFWGAKFWRTLLPKSFAMFNLNENNRFVMAQQPSDMRAGVNKLCGEVRSVGLDPTNGDVYVFVGSSRKLMKLLHWERGGYVMYYKRLEQGRFHPKIFLRQGIGFRSMRWDELVLLMEGISPRVARRRRYQTEVIEQEKDGKITEKSLRKVWLSR